MLRLTSFQILMLGLFFAACFKQPVDTTKRQPANNLSVSQIALEETAHFLSPEGADVAVSAGQYRVDAVDQTQLRLLSEAGASMFIQAAKISHEELMASPIAIAVMEEGQDDNIHLVLLLPEGQGLDAIGSYSAIRSRGVSQPTLKPSQVQNAVGQLKAAPQATAPPSSAAVLRVPPAVIAGSLQPPPGVTPPTPRWITWNYIAMNRPEMLAQAMADVQAGKRPLASMTGFASLVELNDFMKTPWNSEVARITTIQSAARQQARVTTRAISPAVTLQPNAPTVHPAPPLAIRATTDFPIYLPGRDLGAVYSGQQGMVTISLTLPANGYIEAELPLSVTRQRFRIQQITTYTGEIVNGAPVVASQAKGGAYNDIRPKANDPKTTVSMAGFVGLDVRAGQRLDVTVVFEPDAIIGPPVGNYEVPLSIYYFEGSKWTRIVPLRAYCNGINFGAMFYAEQALVNTFFTTMPIDYPVVVTASSAPVVGTISASQLPPGLTMDPVAVSVPAQGKQRYVLHFHLLANAYDFPMQDIGIRLDYGGQTRTLNLSIGIYKTEYFWDWLVWAPGIPAVYWQNNYDDHQAVGLGSLTLLLKNDGEWFWDLFAYNENKIDVGGSDFDVGVQFNANPQIRDTIHVHIGPGTSGQLYAQSNVSQWLRTNFFQAKDAGVTFSIQFR